jgi:hypothetical protein
MKRAFRFSVHSGRFHVGGVRDCFAGAHGQPRARVLDVVGLRLRRPYHFRARIQSFQAVAAHFRATPLFAVRSARAAVPARNLLSGLGVTATLKAAFERRVEEASCNVSRVSRSPGPSRGRRRSTERGATNRVRTPDLSFRTFACRICSNSPPGVPRAGVRERRASTLACLSFLRKKISKFLSPTNPPRAVSALRPLDDAGRPTEADETGGPVTSWILTFAAKEVPHLLAAFWACLLSTSRLITHARHPASPRKEAGRGDGKP